MKRYIKASGVNMKTLAETLEDSIKNLIRTEKEKR